MRDALDRLSAWVPAIVRVGLCLDELYQTAEVVYVSGPETPWDEKILNDSGWIRSEIENGDGGDLVRGFYPLLDEDELPADGYYLANVIAWSCMYDSPIWGRDYTSGIDISEANTWVFLGEDESVLEDPEFKIWWIGKTLAARERERAA